MSFAACRSIRRTEGARAVAAAALLAGALFTPAVDAHRAPGSLTTVQWNSRTGTTEIVHRLHSHDAELGVGTVIGEANLSALTLEGRAHIALYVEERFALRREGERLPLDLLGAEVVADYLLVYQEYPEPLSGDIEFRDDILRDVFPAQVNQVNITHDAVVRTLMFAGDDAWHEFDFASVSK